MQQRRMNNWTNLSDQGSKCLEEVLRVHASGIEIFYKFGDVFRLTFDRTSRIH